METDLGRGPSDLYEHSRVQMIPRDKDSSGRHHSSTAAPAAEFQLDPLLRRVSRVLLPLCFLGGVMNYLDRTNLSFAGLELNADLGFTAVDFGLGSGLFYLGYGLGMVPSTFLTMKYGARWYSFITVAWGVVATCSALMTSRAGLFALRLLLGLTEAGFVTSAFHLMSQFYPRDRIAKPYAFVSISWQLSSTFSAPLAAGIMSLRDVGGLRGWQWLFILEGIPSVILGIAMFIWMPSHPLTARFLTKEEGEFLHAQVHGGDADEARQPLVWKQLATLVWDSAKRAVLWYCILLAFLWAMAMFSLVSWLPVIIKNMLSGTALSQSTSTGGGGGAARNTQAALLTGVPYLCASVCSLINAWSADRYANLRVRELHIAIPATIGGVFLACFTPLYRLSFGAGFAVLVIAMTGAYSGQGIMFARVSGEITPGGPGPAVHDTVTPGIVAATFACPVVVSGWWQQQPALPRSWAQVFLEVLTVLLLSLLLLLALQHMPLLLLPSALLDTKHVGVGLAIFNAVSASAGGLGGPAIVGAIVQRLGSFSYATIITGIFLAISGAGAAFVSIVEKYSDGAARRRQQQHQERLPCFAQASQQLGMELQITSSNGKDV